MAITTANITKVVKVTDTEILVISGTQDLTAYLTIASAASAYQPIDSDLTAIAALTTTSFGRSTLTTANASALRTLAGLGTAATRDVGQAAGNVPVMSADGTLSIGSNISGSYIGTVRLYDSVNDAYLSISAGDSELSLNNFTLRNTGGNIVLLLNTNVTASRSFEFPDKDGTIALISDVGDRYLTSSTTSLLIGNGAKTLTVGTGLAYSPTQDVTVAYNASNHMHASVTSYNSTTGVLVVDVQQHTGAGTYAVWTVNVGGIDAGAIPSGGTTGQVLAKLSSTNYDDAWVTPTVAVSGITGLGTSVDTALAISVGSAGAPVVFNGAGGTPSSITLTNATGYPAATTTTAGTVPTIGATGATVTGAPTRRQMLVAATNQFTFRTLGSALTNAVTSGTGTAASATANNIRLTSTTSAGARSATDTSGYTFGAWSSSYAVADWGLGTVGSGVISIFHTGTPASDTRIRSGIGKSGASLGTIAARGFVIEIQWNGSAWEVFCGVHNGTTLNLQTTGITFATQRSVIWSVEASGSSAVWYVNAGGSGAPYNGQARTTATLTQTGSPTGVETQSRYVWVEINNGASGGAALTVDFAPITFAFGL